MSELQSPNPQPRLFELPETFTGIDGLVPEAQEAARVQLEQDRLALQTSIAAKILPASGLGDARRRWRRGTRITNTMAKQQLTPSRNGNCHFVT